jgi:ribosomal protein S6--L-glutamate ligase
VRQVGIWMYQNGGGDVIEKKLVKQLYDRGIDTVTGLNLREAVARNSGIYINNLKLNDLDLFYSYNAGEQTVYQMYLYETLNKSIPMINNYNSFALTEDKFKTSFLLSQNGVASSEFYLCHREEKDKIKDIFNKWGKMVFKPVDGWGGVGMVLIDSVEKFDLILPFLNQTDFRFFYVEKFLDYDGSDYRVDIVDGEIIGCYGRQAREGDWRTNITSGGSVIKRELNDDIAKVALDAVKITGLEISGVDIIYDRGREEYIVLEVNGIPAFATPEQEKFGIDFNDKKIDKIVELIDRKTSK